MPGHPSTLDVFSSAEKIGGEKPERVGSTKRIVPSAEIIGGDNEKEFCRKIGIFPSAAKIGGLNPPIPHPTFDGCNPTEGFDDCAKSGHVRGRPAFSKNHSRPGRGKPPLRFCACRGHQGHPCGPCDRGDKPSGPPGDSLGRHPAVQPCRLAPSIAATSRMHTHTIPSLQNQDPPEPAAPASGPPPIGGGILPPKGGAKGAGSPFFAAALSFGNFGVAKGKQAERPKALWVYSPSVQRRGG